MFHAVRLMSVNNLKKVSCDLLTLFENDVSTMNMMYRIPAVNVSSIKKNVVEVDFKECLGNSPSTWKAHFFMLMDF